MSDLWKYSIDSRQSNKETIGKEKKTVHMYREGRRGKRQTNILEYRKDNACSSSSSSLKFKRNTDFTELQKYRNLTGIFWIFFWWFKQSGRCSRKRILNNISFVSLTYLMRNAGWGGSSSQTITNIYNFTRGICFCMIYERVPSCLWANPNTVQYQA